jgi:hypothetical protein
LPRKREGSENAKIPTINGMIIEQQQLLITSLPTAE